MRKGIADLHRRAQCSQASNERYFDAMASVNISTPLGEMVRYICMPTTYNDKRVRALRPWSQENTRLLQAVARGEFAVNGLRNRDLQGLLYNAPADSPEEKRRLSARADPPGCRSHGGVGRPHLSWGLGSGASASLGWPGCSAESGGGFMPLALGNRVLSRQDVVIEP